MSASCLYVGTVRHRRVSPEREFRHRLALAYIDLDELPTLLAGRLARRWPGALRFRRRDYHGDGRLPLAEAVRNTVEQQTGRRPDGPIRLLTQLRSYGHCFNPASFYYCLGEDGRHTEAVLAEVTNTPWGERHAYVLEQLGTSPCLLGAQVAKQLHVSPFMDMQHSYRARATAPGATLSVHIESQRDGERYFDATLALERRELTATSARWMAVRYPFATVRVLALIYAHAAGLWLAGVPVQPHPKASER
jgi:hypothetical protein